MDEQEEHLKDFLETQGLNFLKAVINYLFKATAIEHQKLIEAFEHVSEKGKEIAMSTAEKLILKGRQEGRQEDRKGIKKVYFI